ncbi:glycoside hydrolase family 4 [Halosimplex amylolyticum]|uniref:family 4 glycosyl hydrolase n=1 Tax=Halosimplex amylolyticum TaxID=3396616 RepID=UPI003F56B48C
MHSLQAEPPVDGAASDVRIGYVGGGSQGWALTLINDLAQCEDVSGTVTLYDVNYEGAVENAELANDVMDRPDVPGDWSFEAHREMDDALAGADFVVCSTQDPPEETFVHDIDVPQAYGIYQTVADTVGPGGAFRSLRSIPQYREIAATVREQCPDAWVVNYTNPMTVCTRALYAEYPDINAIGLCHEVTHVQHMLADVAERHIDAAEDVSGSEIAVNVKGINHFTWIDEARWRGRDVYQYLDEELERHRPLPGFESGELADESFWSNHDQVAFDLYDRFGVFAAAGDRHLAEFVPWYLDVDTPAEVERWGIRLTPSSARRSDGEAPAKMDKFRDEDGEFHLSESGEEVVDIMRALLGIEPTKTHVNFPNRGQCPDLPDGAVVETNALITGDDISPVNAGTLPRQVRSMVTRAIHNQETLIEAGFAGDLDLAFQAFLNEPLVTIQRDEAQDLFADLVAIEQDYLDAYDVEGASVLDGYELDREAVLAD